MTWLGLQGPPQFSWLLSIRKSILVLSKAILTALFGMYCMSGPFLLLLRRNWRIGQSLLYYLAKPIKLVSLEQENFFAFKDMALVSSAGRQSRCSVQILRAYRRLNQHWWAAYKYGYKTNFASAFLTEISVFLTLKLSKVNAISYIDLWSVN